MPGMSGDDEEHPASSNAAKTVSGAGLPEVLIVLYSHSKMIAIAINIIST